MVIDIRGFRNFRRPAPPVQPPMSTFALRASQSGMDWPRAADHPLPPGSRGIDTPELLPFGPRRPLCEEGAKLEKSAADLEGIFDKVQRAAAHADQHAQSAAAFGESALESAAREAGRVASMLNYFLACLVGPKSTELKVREPDKYFFHPKKLLLEIATTMTHFAKYDEFAAAVVRDERSYNAANMRKAIRVLATGQVPQVP